VYALAVLGSDLYAAGQFTTAGASAATNIAKWNGSSWSAVGSGRHGEFALAVSGTNLYAVNISPSAIPSVAKWDGSSWTALGSGMSQYSEVTALAVSGTDLYAGGNFTTAGGTAAKAIAKWNGSSWTALGSGMTQYPSTSPADVEALAVSGSNVYAGGNFTTAGGSPANYIAKWDGSSWSALGSGMGGNGDNWVWALALSGNDLYAGGWFTMAGGKASVGIAHAYLVLPPTLSIFHSGANVILTWPTNAAGFTLQSTTNLVSSIVWSTNSPAPVIVNGQNAVTNPISGPQKFYRLSQ
jgi:hypothetical protein